MLVLKNSSIIYWGLLYLLLYLNHVQDKIAPGVAILDEVLVLVFFSHVVTCSY
jgi:hypothetical protein